MGKRPPTLKKESAMSNGSKSLFKNVERKVVIFNELPVPAKKAYIWFFAVEACNDLVSAISDVFPQDAWCPNDVPESKWLVMFDNVAAFVGDETFCYMEVPSDHIKALIMEHNREVKEDHDSWESYSKSYGTGGEDHPDHDRFPCIAFEGHPDVVYDGWHRLHHYLSRGHETIPVLEI